MPSYAKLLIGLFTTLVCAWLAHGPFGQSELFVAGLQDRAQAVLRNAELPQVTVRFPRDPLRRVAILSGPADTFQREGLRRFPGINGRISGIPGVAGIAWEDDPQNAERALPLLAELMALAGAAFAIGLGLGWLRFRQKNAGYL